MSRKVKVKVKRGKAKIKLKSSDGDLPLSASDIRALLASSVASALAAGSDPSPEGPIPKLLSVEPRPLLPGNVAESAHDEPTS